MIKDNPLLILSEAQLESLDLLKLKEIKKEILLEFQLTTEPTIEVNGFEIDRNGVLEAFDAIEIDMPLLLFIYQNKVLDDFINGRNENLLTDLDAQAKILEFDDRDYIEGKIVLRLQVLVIQYFKSVSDNSSSNLSQVYRFVQRINPTLVDEIYSNLFKSLQKHMNSLKKTFSGDQLTDVITNRFHDDLDQYVSVSFCDSIDLLPEMFESLLIEYCIWCNDIVYISFSKNKYFHKYNRKDLKTLKQAAICAARFFNKEDNLIIAKDITNYLKSGTGVIKSGPSIGTIIFGLIMVIKVIFLMSNWSSSKSSYNQPPKYTYKNYSTYNNSTYNKSKEEKLYEALYNNKDLQKSTKGKLKKTIAEVSKTKKMDPIPKTFDLAFAGENLTSLNARLVKETEFKDHTELTFNVDAFPTYYTYLSNLLPTKKQKMKDKESWPVVMKFKNPNITEHTFSHRILVDIKDGVYTTNQKYESRQPEYSEDLYLSLKRIPSRQYPLHGVLSRINAYKGELLNSKTFKIVKSKSDEYTVTVEPSGEKYIFTKAYVKRLNVTEKMNEQDRFALAIRNINLVNNKYLKEGNVYTVKGVLGYKIKQSVEDDFLLEDQLKKSAFLKNYVTSKEDNTTYVRLRSDDISIKYLADYKSGRVKGMTMVSSTKNQTELERLQIFSSK